MKLPAWSAPLAIFLFSSGLLLFTLPDYGVTWDEAYPNLPAARRHAQWFAGFLTHPALFSEQTIRDHWQSTSDHPTLVRTLAAFGILFLGKFFSEPTAARIPLALAFSAFLVVVYEWLRRQCGSVWPAAWAALALLFFPRIFAHAHFAALDLPMAMMWVGMLWVFLWARAGRGCAPRTAALRRPAPNPLPRERAFGTTPPPPGFSMGLCSQPSCTRCSFPWFCLFTTSVIAASTGASIS
ncbi:hypothetical protein HS125_01975 [bacterium]|nr:hypothetical protein [bacterium]